MNKINDGGPAFPVWELNGNGQPEMTGFGMTLRDAMALAVAGHIWVQFQRDGTARQHSNWREGVAYEAYKLAEEMLEFREAHNDRRMDDAAPTPPAQAEPSAEPAGEVVVSWTQDRSRIVAVTRQDEEGRILSVIAVAPVATQPSGSCNGMPAYEGPLSAAQAPAADAPEVTEFGTISMKDGNLSFENFRINAKGRVMRTTKDVSDTMYDAVIAFLMKRKEQPVEDKPIMYVPNGTDDNGAPKYKIVPGDGDADLAKGGEA